MVWALDQDDPQTSKSLSNLNVNKLKLLGDDVDLNPGFAMKKLSAMTQQNDVNLVTFWTDCMKYPKCPPGFTEMTKGHGKVSSWVRSQSRFSTADSN